MSFPTADPAYQYEPPPNVCNLCFDPGESPAKVFLCMSDIKIGALWAPGDHEPPNGTIELDATGPCKWQNLAGAVKYHLNIFFGFAEIWIVDAVPETLFLGQNIPVCQPYSANFFGAPPGRKWYGGWGMASNTMPEGQFPVQEVMQAINMEPAAETYASPRPIGGLETVHRFSRRSDATNIHILYDHS